MSQLTRRQLEQGLAELGLGMPDLQGALGRFPSAEVAKAVAVNLKTRARKGFKQAAFRLHPDRNGGDAEKSDLFILAKTVLDLIETIETQTRRPPPPPPPAQVIYHQPASWTVSSVTSSTNADTAGTHTWRIQFVRTG